jgi:long-chain fatty acid transport protein
MTQQRPRTILTLAAAGMLLGGSLVIPPAADATFGYYGQPVPGTQALFNILAPGVTTRHYTLGLSYRLSDRSEISGSFMHAPTQRVRGTNPNTGPQTGFIQMDQNEFELTYTRYLF